jgi:hypothetical protein
MSEAPVASIMSSNTFIGMVEQRIADKGMSYLEAITDVCEKTGLEFENVSKLMTPSMRLLILSSALDQGYQSNGYDIRYWKK